MNLWTYRRPFQIRGHACEVITQTSLTTTSLALWVDGKVVDRADLVYDDTLASQNPLLRLRWPDGALLEIDAGPIGNWRWGIAARLDGVVVHESHPGQPLRWPQWMLDAVRDRAGQHTEAARQKAAARSAQWQRNKWSIGVDVALGLLFFAVAKFTDLTTAALVGAAAGLALVAVQRFVKVDLLGGLALFGIGMLLLSAGFSLVFQDDDMVKMKGTLLGLFTAALFFGDAALNRGRYFGQRLARFLADPSDPQRLSLGLGLMGLVMAALNLGVARWFSTDLWLVYSSFGDTVLSVALVLVVLRFAKLR